MNYLSTLYQHYLSASGICTDTRNITPNSLFFALKGARFDGNTFAAQALDQGASHVVVDDENYYQPESMTLVPDVLAALQALAHHHRMQFAIPFIGITGSNGKTTTKELLAAVLQQRYRTAFTAGNYNNHIGVPLTLLSIPQDTEIAIIEMGANHQGEIADLSRIAHPTHGIINNIGKAHLEGFGGVEGIKKGKSELYLHLAQHGGTGFINAGLPHLPELAAWRGLDRVIWYQDGANDGYQVRLVTASPYLKVALQVGQQEVNIQTHLIGEYNYSNLLTAIAVGLHFGIDIAAIKVALEGYIPSNNRSQIAQIHSNTFILDAYNANPTSMSHAIQHLASIDTPLKAAILGEMKELGEDAPQEHLAIAHQAQAASFTHTILVGEGFAEAAQAIGALYFPDTQALKAWYKQQHWTGYHILLKGSRSVRLEQLVQD